MAALLQGNQKVRINVFVRNLVFFTLFLAPFYEALGQSVSVCDATTVNMEVPLDDAIADVGGDALDANDGSWSGPAGLTFSPVDDANSIVSGLVSGNSYTVTWEHTSGRTYDIAINAGTTPSSATLLPVNGPSFCAGGSITPQLELTVNGAPGDTWRVYISDGSTTFSNTLVDGDSNGIESTTLMGSEVYVDTDFEVTGIVSTSSAGCAMADVDLPPIVSFAEAPAPFVYSVSSNLGNTVCYDPSVPGNVLISLSGSDADVNYQLYRNGVALTGNTHMGTASGGSFSFAPVTASGVYTVRAQALGCAAEVDMTGSVTVWNPPADLPVSISGTPPRCSGDSYIITVQNAENGVTYRLYREGTPRVLVSTQNGTGSDLSFPGQTQAGTYIVTADNGVCAPVELSDLVTISATPEIFNVTGTSGCQGTAVTIGIDDSQFDVTYRVIWTDASGDIHVVGSAGGTGSAIPNIVSYNAIGTYTIIAREPGGCESPMNGSVVVTPSPNNISFESTLPLCNTGDVALTSSQTGVQYELVRDGALTGNTINGTGGRIDFGGLIPGTYTVVARSIINPACEITLSDSRVIQSIPDRPTLSASATEYCVNGSSPSGITLTSPSTQGGVNYQLIRNGSDYDALRVGGGDLDWINVREGTYTLEATTSGGCSNTMDGTVVISGHPLPTATIDVYSASNRRCEGAVNPGFQIEVLLTGTAPFNFQIVDHNGVVLETVTDLGSNSYRLMVDPTDFETTYTVKNLTDASSCSPVDGTGAAVFYVDKVPEISFNPPSPEVCFGSTVSITASGAGTGGTYEWSDGLGNNQTISVGPTSDNTYSVIATSQYGCSSSRDVTVTVNSLPVVDFTPPVKPGDDYAVCLNSGDVALTPSPAGGSFSGTGIVTNSNIFNTVAAGVNSHDITYTYKDTKGCVNDVTKRMVVNRLPVVSITGLAHDYCADDPRVTMYGHPDGVAAASIGVFNLVGGDPSSRGVIWDDNGDGTGWFSPSGVLTAGTGPGDYHLEYIYTDLNGCVNTATWDVTVHLDVSNHLGIDGLPAYMCETDGAITIQGLFGDPLVEVHTNDGVFSGPGIIDNGNGTATFDPAVAHSGLHTITYSYTDPITHCSGSFSVDIQIGTTLSFSLDESYCFGDASVLLNGNPSGGTFNIYDAGGSSISSGSDGTVSFNPAVLAPGDYQVEYVFVVGSCVNTLVRDVEIVANPNAAFRTGIINGAGVFEERTSFCVTQTNAVLMPESSSPMGNFTGDGVGGTTFNPNAAGVGTHTIRYTVINSSGCQSVEEVPVDVVDLPEIDIDNLNSSYCDNEAPFTIQANTHGVVGGVFQLSSTGNTSGVSPLTSIDNSTGEAVFDPSLVGPGVYWVSLEYTHPTSGCTNIITEEVEVFASTAVNFGGLADVMSYCRSSNDVTLTASFNNGSPVSGGVFTISTPSGIGLVDHGDGTATLQPSTLVVGDYDVTYVYTNPNGCETSRTKTIQILPYPTAFDVQGGGHYCIGDVGRNITLSNSQNNVEYELLLNDISLSPPVVLSGTGNPLDFGVQALEGSYTVNAVNAGSNCGALMNGSVDITINDIALTLSNHKNVTCFNGSDGEVMVTASGGSLPYVYLWEREQPAGSGNWVVVSSAAHATGLLAGTYRVTVTDNILCSKVSNPVEISQPNDFNIVVNASDIIAADCYGVASGGFRVTATPGSGSYEFSIDSGTSWQSSPDFNGLIAGTYWVSVRNSATGCEKIDEVMVEVTEPALPLSISDQTITDVACHGGANGEITITAAGGTPAGGVNYVYQWYRIASPSTLIPIAVANGGDSNHIENQPKGDYRVVVADDNGCQIVEEYSISEPDDWTVDYDSTHVSTFGSDDGTIIVNSISGQTAPYQVNVVYPDASVVPGLTHPDLAAGDYEIQIEDAKGCTTSIAVSITQPGDLQVGLSASHVTCYDGHNGFIQVGIKQGNPPYQINWSGNLLSGGTLSGNWSGVDANYTINDGGNGLPAGTYLVEVSDNVGDTWSQSIDVVEPASLIINKTIEKDISCFSAADGEVAIGITTTRPASETDNYDVSWTGPKGFSRVGTLGDANLTHLTGLVNPGLYTVTIFYGGALGTSCNIQEQFNILEPNPLLINVDDVNPVSCNGGSTGSISVSVSGRPAGTVFSFTWEYYDGTAWVAHPATGASINGLSAGQYRVTATESPSGCSVVSDIIEVSVPDALKLTSVKQDVTTCSGDASGSVTLSVNGGIAPYLLNYGTTTVNWDGSMAYAVLGLAAGDYTFTVTDANSCSEAVSVTITEPQPLVVENVSYDIGCEAVNSGTLSFDVSGGRSLSGDYRYRVSLVHQATGTNYGLLLPADGVQPRSVSINMLPEGDYHLEVTDYQSSTPSACPFVFDFSLENIHIKAMVEDATCKGVNAGSVVLSISGGSGDYSYQWTKDEDVAFNRITKDIGSLSAGTYHFTLTDNIRGCSLSRTYTVINAHTLVINGAERDVSCNGANDGAVINVSVSDPSDATFSYDWSGGTLTSPVNTADITGVGPGTYQLEVTDGNGCVTTRSFVVDEPAPISFDLTSDVESCSPYSRSVSLNNLIGGTGNVNDYSFAWNGPGATTTTRNLTGITVGGSYQVTVRDVNDCPVVKSIVLPSKISVDESVSSIDCYGDDNGSIVLHVTGGSGTYSYLWSTTDGSGLVATDKDQTGLTAGTYTVEVTDLVEAASGTHCSVTKDIVISQPVSIVVTGDRTHIICSGNSDGSITLDVTGGSGNYTYNWSSANGSGLVQGQKNQVGLTGGTYSVTVTDDHMCTASRSFEIQEPDPLMFDLDVSPTNCANENRIEIINQAGGSGTYAYTWAGPGVPSGFSGTMLSNLPGGDYTVIMTDVGVGQKCQLTHTVSLTKPLITNFTVTPETCLGSNNGTITLTVANGEIPYAFSWSTSDGSGLSATEQNQSGLSAGHYQVTVTDDRGCDQVLDIEVTMANTLAVAGSVSHVRCFDNYSGAIDITVSGGSGNYLYNWFGPDAFSASDEDITGLHAGSYTVEVIDADLEAAGPSCRVTKTFMVNQPVSAVSISDVNITDVLCRGAVTGAIDITVAGGTSPYRFNWTGPGNILDPVNEDISGLGAGDYHVTITDANDCAHSFGPFTITQPDKELTSSLIEVIDVTINGGSNGAIEIDVDGGSGSYTINWFDASNVEVPGSADLTRVEGLGAGTYRVEISDENSCFTQITGIEVRQPDDLLDLVITHTNVGPCHGADNGTIGVNLIGGTLPYQSITLLDGGGQIGQTLGKNKAFFDNLRAGDYEIVGLDANNVEIRKEVSILQPPVLNLNAVVTQHVECFGASTGIITVSVDGGWPRVADSQYRLSLSGGPSGTNVVRNPVASVDEVFNNLPQGTYTLRVIDDSNGNNIFDVNEDCYKEQVLTITQPEAALTLSRVSGSEEICEGEKPTLQIITADWPVTVQNLEVTLSDGHTYIIDDSPFQFQPVDVPAAGITQYSITAVEISGCSKGTASGTATVEIHPLPTARIFGDPEICYGETTNLGIELSGVSPWSVTISDGTNTWNEIYTQPFNAFAVSPLVNTSYEILSVTDGHCSNVGSGLGSVTVHELPTVSVVGNADLCAGGSTDITFNFSSGTAPWTVTILENGVKREVGPISTPSYDLTVTPLVTTNYELVSVTDSYGCEQSAFGNVRVTVRPWPEMPSLIAGSDIVCQGSTETYSVEAVPNATGYSWSLPTGASIISGAGTREIEVAFATDAVSGALSVFATNGCGNGPVRTMTLNVDKLPVGVGAISGPVELCQGSSGVIYSVSPVVDASVYNWSVPAGFSIVNGQGTATIEVDLDPNINSSVGDIIVTPENGCGLSVNSSVLTVTISALPVAYAGEDQNVCGNSTTLKADPLSDPNWSGKWSVVSGSATIVAPTNPNTQVNNLSRGDVTFKWTVTHVITRCGVSDEVTVRNNQLSVSASADNSLVCDGSTFVTGTAIPSYPNTTGRWTFVTGNATFDNGNASYTLVTDLAPGSNRLRWTLTQNGCESFAETTVINDQPDQAVIDGEELVNLCASSTVVTANVPVEGTGVWTVEKGAASIDDVSSNTINVTGLAEGENVLRWTISKGSCSTYDEVTLRNNQLTVDAGPDVTTCDESVVMEATEPPVGVVGMWEALGLASGVAQFSDGNSATAVVSNMVNGENHLRWTLEKNGCQSFDEVIITSNKPTTAITGSAQTVCGNSTFLTGNEPLIGVGSWSVVEGSGDFVDINDPKTEVTGLAKGKNVFRWTIRQGGCPSFSNLIVYNVKVDAYAGKDTVICDRILMLNATPAPDGYEGHWSLGAGTGGVTFEDGGPTNPQALVRLDYGLNTLFWNVTHIESGCTSSDELDILVNAPNPSDLDAGADQMLAGGAEAFLNASPVTRGVGQWSLISGGGTIENPNNPSTRVTNLRRGPNVFRWTVTIGSCSGYDEVIISNGDVIDANAGPDQTVCGYETVLQANEPDVAIGVWKLVSGSGKFENPFDPHTRVYDLGTESPNVFRWVISYGTGTSSSFDEVTITNNMPDDADAGFNDVICSSDYELKGNTPAPGMGTVLWTLISGSGTIDDPLAAETSVSGLSQGENVLVYTIQKGDPGQMCYSVDSVVITNGLATEAKAGDDQVTCEDSVTLRPNIPNHGVGEWRVIEGSAEFDGNQVTNLAPGLNKFAWVISTALCDSRDTVEIVNNMPSVANAGNDQPVCGTDVQLSGNVPIYGVGEWTPISGSGMVADITDPNSMVSGLAKGRNRFRWTINNNGCISSDEVEIINNLLEADAGDYQVNCADTAVLAANNPSPGVGTWGVLGGSGSAVFDDPEDPYTVVRDLDQGENLLTWTINNGECSTVSIVSITNNLPTTAEAGANHPVCVNSVVLSANNPTVGTGSWTIRNGAGDFVDSMDENTRVDNLNFGANIFRWTIENNGCKSMDDVQIDFNTIEASAGDNHEICSDEYVLEANNADPGVGTWSVVGGSSQAVFEDVNNPTTKVSKLRKGQNVLRWTINHKGCVTFSEVTLTNNSASTAYAGKTQPICKDEAVLDAEIPDIGVGHWEVISGSGTMADYNDPKTTVTGLSKGDNVFRWVVENGLCSSIDEVRVENNLPSIPYAGESWAEVCSPSLTLKASAPEYGQGTWSIIEGSGNFSDPTDPQAEINNLSPGTNRLKWTLTQGQCALSDTIIIENNTPSIANAGPDVADCKNWSALDANTPLYGTGEWSLVSGKGSFVNPLDESTQVEDLGFGENVLMWTISNGKCFSSDQVAVFNKVPDQADAGKDQTFCENYTMLNANDPTSGDGRWSVVSGAGEFEDPKLFNTKVLNVGFGDNVYKWTVGYGECTTEDEVVIRSNKSYPFAGEDMVVYVPEVTLNGNNVGDLNAKWRLVGGAGDIQDTTFFNTPVSGLKEGINTFRWVIDVDGCVAFDDVSVDYRPVPDAGFITDVKEGCYPLTVRFTNYSVGAKSFHWDFGDGNSSGDRNPVHVFEAPGNYTVTLTTPGPDGKDGVSQVMIPVFDHPQAAFNVSPGLVYVPGDKVRFTDLSVGALDYLWNFGDGAASDEQNPRHEYQNKGVYDVKLHVTNQHGCVDSVVIKEAVTAKLAGFITFPNAFSPRPGSAADMPSDVTSETNTVFRPVYRDVDSYQLQIFNRWGQLIFESNDVDHGWDGLYKGQLAPQAVYVWKASGTFLNGVSFRKTGSVLLVR